MNKIKKLQKPIDKDIHLKYRCKKCGLDHWLSLREASTKNFKVVCNCGRVFKVKQVTGCVLKYCNDVTIQETAQDNQNAQTKTENNKSSIVNILDIKQEDSKPASNIRRTIPSDILEKSVKLLLSYGFTKSEATKLVTDTYFNVPVDDYPTLVKYTLQSLGDINNDINNTETI